MTSTRETITHLVRDFRLTRIDATLTSGHVHLRAIPDGSNPLLLNRREVALAKQDSWSLKEAREIDARVASEPVGYGTGADLETALISLKASLQKFAKPVYEEYARRQGYEQPDRPCPFRKGTDSAAHWHAGRERRLTEDAQR